MRELRNEELMAVNGGTTYDHCTHQSVEITDSGTHTTTYCHNHGGRGGGGGGGTGYTPTTGPFSGGGGEYTPVGGEPDQDDPEPPTMSSPDPEVTNVLNQHSALIYFEDPETGEVTSMQPFTIREGFFDLNENGRQDGAERTIQSGVEIQVGDFNTNTDRFGTVVGVGSEFFEQFLPERGLVEGSESERLFYELFRPVENLDMRF